MLEILERIGSGSVQAFWMPVLVWTVLAGVAVLALGALERRLHPLAGHRLRQAVLLALPVSIVVAPWAPVSWVIVADPLRSWSPGALDSTMPPPLETVPLGADAGTPTNVTMVLLGVATVAIILLAVARLAMLAADVRRLRGLRRAAPRVADPGPTRMLGTLAEQLGVGRPVELLEGPPDSVPMTFGARRPVVVVPRSLLDSPESLGTVLAHELVHVRRADYLWALADCLTSAVFAFHPLVWLLRRGIERCRETSCDAEILAAGIVRPSEYAELLARTHTPTQFPTPAVAASMSARSLTLKERLETMEKFANIRLTLRRRIGLVFGAGTLFLLCVAVAACTGKPSREPAVLDGLGSLSLEEPAQSYVIPLSVDPEGPVQYTSISEEEVEEEMARLETQVEYLRERMQDLWDRYVEVTSEWDDLDDEAKRAASRESDDLRLRRDLLRDMRKEAIRRHEAVKLAYETQKRMRAQR